MFYIKSDHLSEFSLFDRKKTGLGLFLALFFCFFPNLVSAATSLKVAHLHELAIQKSLWNDLQWKNLLHYELDGWSNSHYISGVDDSRFFNALDGKSNPKSELLSTITALYNKDDLGDMHPQCRFTARLKWLQEQFPGEMNDVPDVTCKEYEKWRQLIPSHKVTLIFPAYHLNSPSSMFGHTLLRLDDAEEKHGSDWLSVAVNFGANVSSDDNSLFYAFKGLSGGYPGFFIVESYFKKIQEYNQTEKRDIWEYPLNFTPEESNRMVEHLWELKEIEFDYFFFDENCSYRLLELLEVARPGIDLTSSYGLSVIPVDTIRSIEEAGLITGSYYRPSQVTVLENLLKQIKPENWHYIRRLSNDPSILSSDEFSQIVDTEQKLIIRTAYKYLRYKKTGEPRDDKSATISFKLLTALSAVNAEDIEQPPHRPLRPEKGHYTKRASFNLGKENEANYAEIGMRFSFHSLDDNQQGFLQGAQINIGSILFRAVEDESVELQQLDLIDIFSLTPRTELFDPLSWRVYTGLERQLTSGKQRLVAHVTGGAGVAYQPFDDAITYALIMARLERNRGFERAIEPALGLNIGMLYHFTSSTIRIELSGEEFAGDEYRHRAIYSQNFALSQNHSFKITATREEQKDIDFSEINASYQYYFF